ncbi:YuzD family protein [Kurthia sibirica]|uniref:Disulfide oxidoreductase n=1 Tax=Kurthia sibirica TaxID=202750 RepID=A0A2U3AHY9_9BACL|nr:YuzD family protein [Kurthia sibirica]PWI24172.1 disulfide oxidoreductase [Kurthia sibirica]GEK34696.1 putative disulfide oxidoreductase YuzD [Kurthia sibirica]
MSEHAVIVEILGASIQCASCVNAPSSIDTYEWLEAAIGRKYPDQPFTITYINIEEPIVDARHMEWVEKINNDELFYPLVLVNNTVVGEGFIQLPPVYKALEQFGFQAPAK